MTITLTPPQCPEQRMIVALLCSADPLGLASDPHGDAYAETASQILRELRLGGGVDEILPLFLSAGDRLPAVTAFIRSVMGWWHVDVPARWEATVAAAA